ncbi:MAG TPA: hypothetical protein QGF58_01445 [Myxococcota bacterium]|nr:hypothetical protein [Myxococcota bacterium]
MLRAMKPTRRQLVLGAGAFGVLGLVAVAVGHGPMNALDSPFLGNSPRRTLEAVLEVLLPVPEEAARVAQNVDAFLVTDDPVLGGELRLALGVVEHWGFSRFSRRDLESRRATLAAMESSSIVLRRQIFQALRRLALFSWFADPANWDSIGYDGPWV